MNTTVTPVHGVKLYKTLSQHLDHIFYNMIFNYS